MKAHGVFLHGGEDLRERLPGFSREDIGPAEAMRLLENRAASFLGCRPGAGGSGIVKQLNNLYGMSKVYTDILTAALCVRGLYTSGYAARLDLLLHMEEGAVLREDLEDSLIEDILRWTHFKIDPTEDETWSDADTAPGRWLSAAGDLLAAIDRTARLGTGSDQTERIPFGPLLRMWRNAGAGPAAAVRFAFGGQTPDERVREESVRLIRHAAERGTDGRVHSAAGGYPFGKGSWEDSAASAWSAWNVLVSGREEAERA
jgi:hypothetical protein